MRLETVFTLNHSKVSTSDGGRSATVLRGVIHMGTLSGYVGTGRSAKTDPRALGFTRSSWRPPAGGGGREDRGRSATRLQRRRACRGAKRQQRAPGRTESNQPSLHGTQGGSLRTRPEGV
jgi:hypothetical protein